MLSLSLAEVVFKWFRTASGQAVKEVHYIPRLTLWSFKVNFEQMALCTLVHLKKTKNKKQNKKNAPCFHANKNRLCSQDYFSLSIMPKYTLNYRLKKFQKQKFKKAFHCSKISAFHKGIKETDKGFWKKQMWSFVNSNTKVVTDSKFLHKFFVIDRETNMPLS